jgi:hypothetical protein
METKTRLGYRGRIQRKTWCIVELTITTPSLCRLQSRLHSNTFTTGNPMPKLTLSVRDVGFGLRAACGNRVSHKNMNPSLTCPFSLFISEAITNLFREHTPAVLLPRKRSVKQGCQQKYLGHTAWENM